MTSFPIRKLRAPWLALPSLLTLLAVVGCQSTQPAAREEATDRWNAARAQIKAKLAADYLTVGNVDDAATELAEAAKLTPTDAQLIPLRAQVALAQGKIAQAENILENTQLLGTRQAEIEYLRGVVYQMQQRWDDAREAYQRAASIRPDESAYVIALTQAHLQANEPERALRVLETVAGKFAWTYAFQVALAECHEQLGDWSGAAGAWQRAGADEAAGAETNDRLAAALFQAGRFAEAQPLLQSGLTATDPDGRMRLLEMLAESLLATGDAQAARTHAQQLTQLAPESARALRLLSRCYAANDEYDEALRVAQSAVGRDAHDPRSLELCAALAWRKGDRELTQALATRLQSIDRESEIAQRLLARLASIEHG